jgi:hypothetical protein
MVVSLITVPSGSVLVVVFVLLLLLVELVVTGVGGGGGTAVVGEEEEQPEPKTVTAKIPEVTRRLLSFINRNLATYQTGKQDCIESNAFLSGNKTN